MVLYLLDVKNMFLMVVEMEEMVAEVARSAVPGWHGSQPTPPPAANVPTPHGKHGVDGSLSVSASPAAQVTQPVTPYEAYSEKEFYTFRLGRGRLDQHRIDASLFYLI